MKRTKITNIIVPMTLGMAVFLAACGKEQTEVTETPVVELTLDGKQAVNGDSKEQTAESGESSSDTSNDTAAAITEEQAYAAVINYCKATNPDFTDEPNSAGAAEYWNVSTDENGMIVVLYRSYTAAQIRYYVDPATGETYVTEMVPGITDDEQPTGESFNVRDYLEAAGDQSVDTSSSDNGTGASDDAQAPVEYETADGFMGSFLLASDRDKIDTANDYGVLYRVVYKAYIEGDELIACGSMDYRNSKDQDPITISSDVTHIFKVDENTVYQKQGEAELETLSKEEFAGCLDSRKDSGMYFEVEVSGGVVRTALLY